MFIYDEDKNKKIKGTPEPIDETSASVKHTFKFDNDDFPNSAGRGTQIITCIELHVKIDELFEKADILSNQRNYDEEIKYINQNQQ
jgi:hypothetical protein